MHIDFNSIDRKFKGPIIFNSNKNQKFIDSQLFILFRDPVELIISEFNFQYHILLMYFNLNKTNIYHENYIVLFKLNSNELY